MDDRRRFPRLPERDAAAVTIIEAPAAPDIQGTTFFAETQNISEGGILLHLPRFVPPRSELRMRIALRAPLRAFLITGSVAWSLAEAADGHHATGIQFIGGHAGDFEAWQTIVAHKTRHLPRP